MQHGRGKFNVIYELRSIFHGRFLSIGLTTSDFIDFVAVHITMPSNVGKVRKENSWFFMFEKSLSIFKLLEYLNAAVAKSKNWLSEMQVLRQFSLALKTWQGEEFSKVITINDTWS